MVVALSLLGARALNFLRNEKGVVAWEYLLVVAGVSVAIIVAIAVGAPSLTAGLVTGTCNAINTIPAMSIAPCP